MTMKDIAAIIDEALARARACVSQQQAIEAGCLFGGELSERETDLERRKQLRTALSEALKKTAHGSHAQEFIHAVLSIVLVT